MGRVRFSWCELHHATGGDPSVLLALAALLTPPHHPPSRFFMGRGKKGEEVADSVRRGEQERNRIRMTRRDQNAPPAR